MGADITLACVWFSKDAYLEAECSNIKKQVNALPDGDLEVLADHMFLLDDEYEPEMRPDVIEDICDVVDKAFKSFNLRDVAWLHHKGEIGYITGGMSYGDSPTGSYDYIYGLWQVIDYLDYMEEAESDE